jgi:hypothetical protein
MGRQMALRKAIVYSGVSFTICTLAFFTLLYRSARFKVPMTDNFRPFAKRTITDINPSRFTLAPSRGYLQTAHDYKA